MLNYKTVENNIKFILKIEYDMSDEEIENAINSFSLETLFEENPEIITHTSNERWAEKIYIYWKNNS